MRSRRKATVSSVLHRTSTPGQWLLQLADCLVEAARGDAAFPADGLHVVFDLPRGPLVHDEPVEDFRRWGQAFQVNLSHNGIFVLI